MGTFKKGILGGFSGTVGTVVGGNWKGIDYMRSRPVTKKTNESPARLVQQAKFAVATKFLRSMRELLKISYRESTGKMTGTNSALSFTLKNAVTGVYPNLQVDYRLAQVAKGSLPNVAIATPASTVAGRIDYSWRDNSGTGSAAADDQALLVVYNEELNQAFYTIQAGTRSDAAGSIELPSLIGKQVHTWISFVSAKGKDVASSIYTGVVTVL